MSPDDLAVLHDDPSGTLARFTGDRTLAVAPLAVEKPLVNRVG